MGIFQNLTYKTGSHHSKHLLDIYTPQVQGIHPVLFFVHGGSWYYGSKDLYRELGRHMANKGLVTVITNYRLGAETTYEGMADDIANALKWTSEHIGHYGGDQDRIFLAGHSAGGHLSALVTLNIRFLESLQAKNPVRGCILIDAFGLNMDYAMQQNQTFFVNELRNVFTKDPNKWKDAAPVRFIRREMPPFLILTGSRTYPYITLDNELFKMALEAEGISFKSRTVAGKDHMSMITDLKDSNDTIYQDVLDFIMHSSPFMKAAS